jgi:hypothetical protein
MSDTPITHDSLYKQELLAQFGPNFLPLLKLFSLIIAFIFIIIILLSNMSTAIQTKEPPIEAPTPQLTESIVRVNKMTLK